MFNQKEGVFMDYYKTEELEERAILVGVHTGCIDELSDTTDESMKELEQLAETAGAVTVGTMVQNRATVENATYLGEGKLDELKAACGGLHANLIIFDDELSPIQLRNLERELSLRVIDRTMLILDIFARRASTKEGKIQVELAQLNYMLPRLSGLGTQLSRLGAGIGTRGPGETKLETDRRHIRRRISHLREELREVKKHRDLLRTRREKDNSSMVALVGYTNAGKSTLLNTLTGAEVFAENKLFATLDPTIRGLELSDGRKVMLVDTVGFIRKLPHHLVEAFKSTLEEAVFADVLIHVIDGANPEFDQHIRVVDNILESLKAANKPTVCVFNKIDKVGDRSDIPLAVRTADAVVEISAKTGEGLEKLVQTLESLVPGKKKRVKLLIPFSDGAALSRLHNEQTVLSEQYEAEGTLLDAYVDTQAYAEFKNYLCEV